MGIVLENISDPHALHLPEHFANPKVPRTGLPGQRQEPQRASTGWDLKTGVAPLGLERAVPAEFSRGGGTGGTKGRRFARPWLGASLSLHCVLRGSGTTGLKLAPPLLPEEPEPSGNK